MKTDLECGMQNADLGIKDFKSAIPACGRQADAELERGGEYHDAMEMFKLWVHVWSRYRA